VSSENDDDDFDTDESSSISVNNVDESLSEVADITSELQDNEDMPALPPHIRCGNNLLNLVASCNALKARKEKAYQRNYNRAMGKVQVMSNAVNRS